MNRLEGWLKAFIDHGKTALWGANTAFEGTLYRQREWRNSTISLAGHVFST